jgi:hypothetical protein
MSFTAPATYAPRGAAHGASYGRIQPAEPAAPTTTRARFLLPFALALVIVLGAAAYGVFRPPHASPAAPGARGSLVWGDGVFANRLELRAWLHLHDGSFTHWAQSHPAALKLVP